MFKQLFKLRLGASRSQSVGLSVFQTRFQTSCLNRVSKQALETICKASLETLFGQLVWNLVWKELHYHLIILNAV